MARNPWDVIEEVAPKVASEDPWAVAEEKPLAGRDARGAMLPPSNFYEQPAYAADVLPGLTAGASAYADRAMGPRVDPATLDMGTPFVSMGDVFTEAAEGGLAKSVGGVVQGAAEKLQAPFAPLAAFREREDAPALQAVGELFGPLADFYDPAADLGADIAAMGSAVVSEARRGAINPQTLDDFGAMAAANPDGAMRYLVATSGESVPAILAALATRNPRAAEAMMGTTTYGSTYAAQRQDGASPMMADRQGMTAALLETASARVPMETVLGKGYTLPQRLWRAPLQEGVTEVNAGASQAVAEALIAGKPIEPGKVLLEGAVGGLVGTGMGVGEAVAGRGPDKPLTAAQKQDAELYDRGLADGGIADARTVHEGLRNLDSSTTPTILETDRTIGNPSNDVVVPHKGWEVTAEIPMTARPSLQQPTPNVTSNVPFYPIATENNDEDRGPVRGAVGAEPVAGTPGIAPVAGEGGQYAARPAALPGQPQPAPSPGVAAAPAPVAVHADPGEAPQPVTPAVIGEAVAKSAANTPLDIKAARTRLVDDVTAAITKRRWSATTRSLATSPSTCPATASSRCSTPRNGSRSSASRSRIRPASARRPRSCRWSRRRRRRRRKPCCARSSAIASR
jgi:hypothetical protein